MLHLGYPPEPPSAAATSGPYPCCDAYTVDIALNPGGHPSTSKYAIHRARKLSYQLCGSPGTSTLACTAHRQ
jgi:hypothetical protein